MSQQAQMNMAAMGGPVGGGMAGAQINAGTPNSGGMSNFSPEYMMKKLNTSIYDYLLRNAKYDVAKMFLEQMEVETKDSKESPGQRGLQNGIDNGMDETKDEGIANRPAHLPLANNLSDGPFLQDWWLQFWEIWHSLRGKASNRNGTQTYIGNQRTMQKGRFGMIGAMDPNMQNMRGNYMLQGMNNGMAMSQNDLRKSAMQQNNQQRNLNPQQMAQMKNAQQNAQMMQGNAMERQSSQLDGSGPRSGSPGSGDGPSSPKRQRVEGGMQQMTQGRPGQPGQMQGTPVGIPFHTLPANMDSTLPFLSAPPANEQVQSMEGYSHSIQQQMQTAMNNHMNKSNNMKGMNPNLGPGGAQGSPMAQPGMDGATGEFYASVNGARMPMPQNAAAAAAAANGQPGSTNGNHALQDYQMQLMLLEQQNKKRLLMARQEQDTHVPGVAPNGQFAPGMSPQGSQRGVDPPNPNDMRGMMDPSQIPQAMRAQMVMGPNGQMMRPPSSHPLGGMTPQQVEAMRQQGMANGQFVGQPPQAGMMQGAQAGQPGQGQPMGTPRQQPNNMPPPPAPPANASGTQPSSPSSQQPPPTPNQTNKAKPGTKKEAAKKGNQKKGGAAANATSASESEQPPTPTPATPATPMNANSFAHKQNAQMPNGAPPPNVQAGNASAAVNAPNQQAQNAGNTALPPGAAPVQEMPFGSLGLDGDQFNNLGLDFDMGGDTLDSFDFDSFLTDGDDGGFQFDANLAFDGSEIGLDGTG